MAQSSNYKVYNRQTRTLTEETSFSGGMMWTGNNIDETHLKTIVNFNYDDTTGFLKTRNPLKPMCLGDKLLQFYEEVKDGTGKVDISVTETIEGLYDKQLIGAYNMCYTDKTDDDLISRAGWLYLFGTVDKEDDQFVSRENSLVWLYLDDNGSWHTVHPVEEQLDGKLVGTTGVEPILYDNTLYCTNADETQAFYAYRIFKIDETVKTETDVDLVVPTFYVHKQHFNSNYESYFDDDAKTLIDSVTLLEATATGFNGLRGSEMYTYTSTTGNGTRRIKGAYLKDTSGAHCVTPRVGQSVKLHVILDNVPEKDKGVIVLQRLVQGTVEEANAIWGDPKTQDASTDVVFDRTISEETEIYNLVWLSGTDENATRYDGLFYKCPTNKLNTTMRIKEYAVPTARGSCLWNTHLVLWDIEGSTNTLFISETENFYYMPVPNNVAVFESDIISCIPYMGALLVFTADRVYRLVEDNNGAFAQEVVQNNMPLVREDAAYVRAIKNMVFFKSGKYYYMIVPKAQSLTGELTVAPVYKNLAGWFDNPNAATKEMLSQMYPENQYILPKDADIADAVVVSDPVAIYVEQDTVSILYNIDARCVTTQQASKPLHGHAYEITDNFIQSFALFVNYNTNLRAWTMYLEDTTQAKLYPAALTAARLMSFVRVTTDGHMYLSAMQESTDLDDGVRCLIDTGYRTLANALKKRFREVQIKLYNATENITSFGSAFFVDGSVRRNYKHLEEVLTSGDTGYVSLAPVYDPNTFLIEPFVSITEVGDTVISDDTINKTIQGSDSIELSNWTLDFSHFKRGAPSTVRVPVSGKGYAPRFIFMSPKCIALHLNEINWVYRIMNGR
jgi:hypothetical protein